MRVSLENNTFLLHKIVRIAGIIRFANIILVEGPYMRKYGSYKLESMLMGLFFVQKKNAINSHKGFVSVGFLIKRPFKLRLMYKVPYQRHHKLLLITSCS